MAKKVIIVRHGESTGNIGMRNDSPITIPLSEKGEQQAEALVELLPTPDAVIVSSYTRTHATALPLLRKFPAITPEEWSDIREMNFLSAQKHPNTTQEERMIIRQAFWDKNDPYYQEDESSESFQDFLSRGERTIENLKNHSADTVVVFTHDIFIRLLLFIHEEQILFLEYRNTEEGLKHIMRLFREKMRDTSIPNAVPIDISHLLDV